MPVAPRATFFFKDGNYGWTETYHSLKPDLTATMTAARALIPLRVACMGVSAHMPFVRVSDDLIKRDSMIFPVPPGDQFNKAGASIGTSPNVCLNVRLEATTIIRRNLSMRGIPANLLGFGGSLEMSADFLTSFRAYGQKLLSDDWAVKGADRLITKYDISNVVQDIANGDVTVTTFLPHGLDVNDPVTIRGLTGSKFLNGNWALFAVPSTTTVKIKMNRILVPWTGGGTISKAGFLLSRITKVTERDISHRNAGRPFDSPRGRR